MTPLKCDEGIGDRFKSKNKSPHRYAIRRVFVI